MTQHIACDEMRRVRVEVLHARNLPDVPVRSIWAVPVTQTSRVCTARRRMSARAHCHMNECRQPRAMQRASASATAVCAGRCAGARGTRRNPAYFYTMIFTRSDARACVPVFLLIVFVCLCVCVVIKLSPGRGTPGREVSLRSVCETTGPDRGPT